MSSSVYADSGVPGKEEVIFLPLGGAGEIGMNLNLYGHAGKWLMVDMGITFDDGENPGIDVLMPDPAFIDERREDIVGLILTHAHEDHLGAVQYLWDDFDCPIYATPFTAAVLRRKLGENDFGRLPEIVEIPLSGTFSVGPFDVELITLTHSIPEPNALILRCSAGSIMHTGDWKLDPDPLIGPTPDEKALMRAGDEGVLAMICDSTNALNKGWSGSEGVVRDKLTEVIATQTGRVAVACFASNVARVESAAKAGAACGRQIALVGRSLHRMVEAARMTGYLKDLPPLLSDQDAARLPRHKVLYICTGSQGEPRAALTRIAKDDHQYVSLDEGDTVLFSSREIPGNEVSIGKLQNQLTQIGCNVITANDHEIHASGHPNQDELSQMYQWIRPKIAVPVHGEYRHLKAHAELARTCQVPYTLAPLNGDVLSLSQDGVAVVDEVYAGRLALDGDRLVPMDSPGLKERKRIAYNGCAVVSVAVDGKGSLRGMPEVTVFGLFGEDDLDTRELEDVVEQAVETSVRRAKGSVSGMKEQIRIAVRRALQDMTGKRPPVSVHLVTV